MRRKLFIVIAGVVLTAASAFVFVKANNVTDPFLEANVEALTRSESSSVMSLVCKYLGCCGGDNKCFSGTITIKGVQVQGTFYMK